MLYVLILKSSQALTVQKRYPSAWEQTWYVQVAGPKSDVNITLMRITCHSRLISRDPLHNFALRWPPQAWLLPLPSERASLPPPSGGMPRQSEPRLRHPAHLRWICRRSCAAAHSWFLISMPRSSCTATPLGWKWFSTRFSPSAERACLPVC